MSSDTALRTRHLHARPGDLARYALRDGGRFAADQLLALVLFGTVFLRLLGVLL